MSKQSAQRLKTERLFEINKTQQTAVEWLYDNLKSHFEHDGDLLEAVKISFDIAKQKEKKQMMDAIICNQNGLLRRKTILEAEKYYNETYKTN